jgi:hypothetical protein
MATTFNSNEITAVNTNGGTSLGPNEAHVKTAKFTATMDGSATPILNVARLPGGSKVQFVAMNLSAGWTSGSAVYTANAGAVGIAVACTGAVVAKNTGIGDQEATVGEDGLVICTFVGTPAGTEIIDGTVYYV